MRVDRILNRQSLLTDSSKWLTAASDPKRTFPPTVNSGYWFEPRSENQPATELGADLVPFLPKLFWRRIITRRCIDASQLLKWGVAPVIGDVFVN